MYTTWSVENPWNWIIPRVCDSSQLLHMCVSKETNLAKSQNWFQLPSWSLLLQIRSYWRGQNRFCSFSEQPVITKESRLQVESVPLPTNLISTSNEAATDNYCRLRNDGPFKFNHLWQGMFSKLPTYILKTITFLFCVKCKNAFLKN